MKFTINIFLLCLLFACSTSKSTNSETSDREDDVEEEGKCYAMVKMPNTLNVKKEYVAVYTGDKMVKGVTQQTVQISEPSTKWVKKTADRNCISADPNDCLVWCLIDVPGESKTLNIVSDTSKIKDFVMRPINLKTNASSGGQTKKMEVLCNSEATPEMIQLICNKLISKGYLKKDEIFSAYNDKIEAALLLFQEDFGLPIGDFDMMTLKTLGVK